MPPLIIFTSKTAKSNHHADPESQRGHAPSSQVISDGVTVVLGNSTHAIAKYNTIGNGCVYY
jgi:hypothetical protein